MYSITAIYNDEEIASATSEEFEYAKEQVMEELAGSMYAGESEVELMCVNASGLKIKMPAYF